jgi:hypothetical protein
VPADAPTILATSGGIGAGKRTRFTFTALTDFAVELSGVTLLYRGTDLVEAVAENSSAGAYFVEARDGSAVETTLDVRRL